MTNLPEGVYSNQLPDQQQQRQASIQMRDLAADVTAAFTAVDPPDGSAGIKELLGMGDPDSPWESFTRTEIESRDQVLAQARELTRAHNILRQAWPDAPFGGTRMGYISKRAAFLIYRNWLMVSLHRKGRHEGVQVGGHLYYPGYDRDNGPRRIKKD
ncbi:MAG: hypothetical protein VW518_04305 [Burkholderiaceae bacterium]